MTEYALAHPCFTFWIIIIFIIFTADTIQTFAKKQNIKNCEISVTNQKEKQEEQSE